MVQNIIGTPYEYRQMQLNVEVNSIEDIIKQTGEPYIKAKYLLPIPFDTKQNQNLLDAAMNQFEGLVRGVDWKDTQMLGVGVISPVSGYYYLQVFDKDVPIETNAYFWKRNEEGCITRISPPRPCTRELEIIKELTDFYSKLIRTQCTEADLRDYADSWPEDRPLE